MSVITLIVNSDITINFKWKTVFTSFCVFSAPQTPDCPHMGYVCSRIETQHTTHSAFDGNGCSLPMKQAF